MRTTPVQPSFTAGELSPRLHARIDLDSYYDGAAKLDNFFCLPQGPILRRGGTTFISQAGSTDVRLIPFVFSADQSLVIELGNKYARFYFEGGQITNADGTPYQIATPYTFAQVKDLDYAQSGDIMYLTHPKVQPQKLQRNANNNWSISAVALTSKPAEWTTNNWPAHVVFYDQRLYFAATPKQPQTIWASRVGLFDDFTYDTVSQNDTNYTTTEVDTLVSKAPAGFKTRVRAILTTGNVSTGEQSLTQTNITDIKKAWEDANVNQALRERALNTLGFSTEIEVLDDFAFSYTIASNEVNGIRWLMAVNILVAGTSGAEYKITASNYQDAITPKSIKIARQTSYGSAGIKPVQMGTAVAYVQRGGTRIRLFEYAYSEDQYVSTDLSVTAEHILKRRVEAIALQTVHDPCLWCVMADGSLVGLTYDKQQKVIAWHNHTFNGKVKSLAIIPGTDGKADQLWLAIEREINGTTVTYIEALLEAFSEVYNVEDSRYLDAHLDYIGDTAIAQVGGLEHLEGVEVGVLVDGWVHPNCTVKDGSVVLQSAGKNISIGIPFTSYFESCMIQSQENVTLGYKKRIYGVEVNVLSSLGLEVGIKDEEVQEVFMGPTKVMNKAQPLFTGTLNIKAPSSSANERALFIQQTNPLPCIVRAVKYDMEVNQ